MERLPVVVSELRALDRLTDGQLAAVELLVYYGLPAGRVAQRLAIDESTVRRWFRDSRFTAACIELTRAYAAGQLVPLALFQCRRLLSAPDLKARDAMAIGRFAAELAGMATAGARMVAPLGGVYAPSTFQQRPLDSLSADELAAASARAVEALRQLDSDSDTAGPLD